MKTTLKGLLAASLLAAVAFAPAAQAEDTFKIGFGMAQTGPLAGSGKSAILAMKIWQEDINAKGGLLGKKVELVYYDDQSSPANVPAIYTKLIDVDKVDLINSGYATPMIAAAMPIAMQHNMVLMGLFGLANNAKFHYDKFFGMAPVGENPIVSQAKPVLDLAMTMNPKPKTIAIIAPELEFGHAVIEGIKAGAGPLGLQVVYDRPFPPTTQDFSTIVREVQATKADVVVIGTQPGQSIGVTRAVNEVGLNAMMVGGLMTGLQTSDAEALLGEQLNGFVNFNYWLPSPKMQFPGALDFLKKYQERAKAEGVDPLGYYIAPWAYSDLQILAQAVEATKSTDGEKMAAYIHGNTMKTIIGDIKYGPGGEWAEPRILMAQFHNVKGNDIEQFKGDDKLVLISPDSVKSGEFIYPFDKARK